MSPVPLCSALYTTPYVPSPSLSIRLYADSPPPCCAIVTVRGRAGACGTGKRCV